MKLIDALIKWYIGCDPRYYESDGRIIKRGFKDGTRNDRRDSKKKGKSNK